MTVEQLIKELEKYPKEYKILIPDFGMPMEVISIYPLGEGEVVLDVE